MKKLFLLFLLFTTSCVKQTVDKETIRQIFIENPDILTDTIKSLEIQEKAKQKLTSLQLIKNIKPDDVLYAPIIGKKDAKLSLYYFFDYPCGFSKKENLIFNELLNSGYKFSIILKPFPIFGKKSELLARAIISSKNQDIEKTQALHNLFFNIDFNLSELDIYMEILKLAKQVGLDTEKLEKDMNSDIVINEIQRTKQLAKKLDIKGTPFLIVGNDVYRGYIEKDVLINSMKN